jgi:uncharacterized protein YqgC (DUF456 family)
VDQLLGWAGKLVFLTLEACVLLLNAVALPGNWLLLALAGVYAWLTDMHRIGWGSLAIMAGLAVVAEALEATVGLVYTAKRGATRRGTFGAFLGGFAGAVLTAGVAPPLGPMLGAFGGTFAGAYLLEYLGQRQHPQALRAGRAAFVGRILAAALKTLCGFWMWCVLAWRLLAPV